LIILLNTNTLYSTFGVQTIEALHQALIGMAPSMVEYYLSDLCSGANEQYLNMKNVQQTITIDQFHIHFDYDENIYLQIDQSQDDLTGSFW
jgi:hypothetical protein